MPRTDLSERGDLDEGDGEEDLGDAERGDGAEGLDGVQLRELGRELEAAGVCGDGGKGGAGVSRRRPRGWVHVCSVIHRLGSARLVSGRT